MAKPLFGLRFVTGLAVFLNFVIFWAIPIAVQGILWKGLKRGDFGGLVPCRIPGISSPFCAFYNMFNDSVRVRSFAKKYIYTRAKDVEYFTSSYFQIISAMVMVFLAFYWQMTHKSVHWWMIMAYNFMWVGPGGRSMGSAYSIAHEEGHNPLFYKQYFRKYLPGGNIFENLVGCFFGSIPFNFSKSHSIIHHRLQAGQGDTFYMWDISRCSLHDFMLYLHRILMHMAGVSSYVYFLRNKSDRSASLLLKGIISYWLTVPIVIYAITRSLGFIFWFYLQPLLCMTFFLALINIGFHGFIEFDGKGEPIKCINATTIINGEDDYFGEDDHMAHHYATNVFYKDLDAYRETQREEFARYKASVFEKLSIAELSVFLILGQWEKLADHYVDYSNSMDKQTIARLLETRAKRKELNFEDYLAKVEQISIYDKTSTTKSEAKVISA